MGLRYKSKSGFYYELNKTILLKIAALASLALISLIIAYGFVTSYTENVDVIGQTLVDTEFPPPSIFPVYLKPVTWLMIFIIIEWYCMVELTKDKFRALDRNSIRRSMIFFIIFLSAVFSFYEMLFNFMLWGSLLSSHTDPALFNPDKMVNNFPNDEYKMNLVFVTKMLVTYFGCSLYGLMIFREKGVAVQ